MRQSYLADVENGIYSQSRTPLVLRFSAPAVLDLWLCGAVRDRHDDGRVQAAARLALGKRGVSQPRKHAPMPSLCDASHALSPRVGSGWWR